MKTLQRITFNNKIGEIRKSLDINDGMTSILSIRLSIQRICISDYESGICFNDCIYKTWNGPNDKDVTKLVKFFWQFANEIDGGEVNRVNLGEKKQKQRTIRRSQRFGSMGSFVFNMEEIEEEEDNNSIVSNTDDHKKVIVTVFYKENIDCAVARKFCKQIADDFVKKYDEIISEKSFREKLNVINDGNDTFIEELKIQVLQEFKEYSTKVDQFRKEFLNFLCN